jgi:hypothetical protein
MADRPEPDEDVAQPRPDADEDVAVPRPDLIAETLQGLGEAGSALGPEPEPPEADPTGGAVIPRETHRAERALGDGRRLGVAGPEASGPWGTDEPTKGEGPWGVTEKNPMDEGSEVTAVPERTPD